MHTEDNDLEDELILHIEQPVVPRVAVSWRAGRMRGLVEHAQVEVLQGGLAQVLDSHGGHTATFTNHEGK